MSDSSLHGLMAEFDTPGEIVRSARSAREAGYRNMDAYSPFPVEGLAEAVGMPRSRIPLLVLLGGRRDASVDFSCSTMPPSSPIRSTSAGDP